MQGGGNEVPESIKSSEKKHLDPILLHSLMHPKLIETDSITLSGEKKKRRQPEVKGEGKKQKLHNHVDNKKFSHKFSFL